jgi:2-polyprenyl-3-methyl-5-hydroxy-6-metoxy-1,4-benzoquinol methylase
VRCARCGLVRLNPRPDVSELGRIYPSNYYAYSLVSEDLTRRRRFGVSSLVQGIKLRMYQRRLLRTLEHAAIGAGPIRLLDVGCADGRLLDWYKASPEGHRIETCGIDMNEQAVEMARQRGHQVVLGRFEEENELPRGSFHLILASHVIEHVADPKGFAAHAFDLLVPGGLFVAATPNFDSVDVRLFGRHWGGNHFPRHWTFYDADTINGLAEAVGFRVERVEYEVNPVFWNWSFHSWLREKLPRSSVPDRLFPPVAIFHPSPQSFVLLSAFTVVDLVLKAVTGKTASMSVEMRKPG